MGEMGDVDATLAYFGLGLREPVRRRVTIGCALSMSGARSTTGSDVGPESRGGVVCEEDGWPWCLDGARSGDGVGLGVAAFVAETPGSGARGDGVDGEVVGIAW